MKTWTIWVGNADNFEKLGVATNEEEVWAVVDKYVNSKPNALKLYKYWRDEFNSKVVWVDFGYEHKFIRVEEVV